MTSLYNRATPSQRRILRAIEGAIKNTCDAHTELQISPQHRRSIAKRAAGTLTAQWPEVLAAAGRPSSESSGAPNPTRTPPRSSELVTAAARRALRLAKRPPWQRLISELSRPIKGLKDAGDLDRAQFHIDVLRAIHRLRQEHLERT